MLDPVRSDGEIRLSIILVNYNTRDDLVEALRTLREYPSAHETEVIVVDNASTDGSPEEIARLYPQVRLLANAENVGYSRGVNQGIEASRGEFFLILNPDIRVTRGSLDRLLEHALHNPDIGIAGAKLLNTDGSLQHSCRTFYSWKTLLYRRTILGKIWPNSSILRRHLMLDWDHETTRDVDWMLGACLLVRRSAVEDVGFMDERFFLYFEDVDWCYRMKAHGWRVVYVADSIMIHEHRRDSAKKVWGRQSRSHLNSMFRFFDKWSHSLYRLKSRRHWARLGVHLLTDLAMINAAFLLAYLIRLLLGAVFTKPVFPLVVYGKFLLFTNLTTGAALFMTGYYKEEEPLAGAGLFVDRMLGAFRAAGIAYLVITAATFLTQTRIYSRVLVTIFFLLVVVLLALGRYGLDRVYRAIRRGAYDLRRTIVVGSGELPRGLADQLRTFPDLGYELVGFVKEGGGEISGRGLLGTTDDLPRLVRKHRVTDLFLAGVPDPIPLVSSLLLRLPDAPVTVRVVSDLAAITVARGKAEEILNLPVLRFERRTLLRYRPGRKRALDWILSAPAAILTSPLFLLLLLLAAWSGVRPLFEREQRRHFRGEVYSLTRFRTPARGEGGALARLLRRLFEGCPALAGIPVLYSVLAGPFSFVGPHLEEPAEGQFLEEWQRLITTMRPGVYPVSDIGNRPWIPFRDPVGLNLYYLQYWSVGLDLQIILRKFLRSLSGGGSPRNE